MKFFIYNCRWKFFIYKIYEGRYAYEIVEVVEVIVEAVEVIVEVMGLKILIPLGPDSPVQSK